LLLLVAVAGVVLAVLGATSGGPSRPAPRAANALVPETVARGRAETRLGSTSIQSSGAPATAAIDLPGASAAASLPTRYRSGTAQTTVDASSSLPGEAAAATIAAPAASTPALELGGSPPAPRQTLGALPGPGEATGSAGPDPYRPGEVLVGFHSGTSAAREHAIEHQAGALAAWRLGPRIKPVGHGRTAGQEYLEPLELRVPEAQTVPAVERLRQNPAVAYAEPNYLEVATAKPNDPEFAKQWGDENTGQLIPFQNQTETLGAEEAGTPGADDRANQAWNFTTGSRSIVIGEVDSGVAYEHPDLAANIWSNPGGVNECAAGTHGYNVLAKTCNPIDEDTTYNGHGTHVAGIMGAVGNNAAGVAGMNWQTTILPVRWMNNASTGETSSLIAALQWLVAAKQAGVNVRVANDSDTFAGVAKSEALEKEIETLGTNEVLFVTAAGNTAENNDTTPRYPCSYNKANEICVTASNNKDQLPAWANIGAKSVQLAAPGVSIYSTLRGNSYGYLSGGSMASPQVAGAAALILSKSSMKTSELKADILNNVDKLTTMEGLVETGGRLDVCKALAFAGCKVATPPREETFGYKEIGPSTDKFASERKRVNRYTLPTSGSVTKLNIYLWPVSTSGQQVMKGVIYSDASGKPENLLAVSEQLTYKGTNEGWYELPFASPVNLSAGNYWIGVITGPTNSIAGFRWLTVSNARDYNTNTYSSGPTNPFGAVTTDSEQTSLYASFYAVPVNTAVPQISGTAQQEKTLTELHGSWTNEPTSFTYQWQQCDSSGNNCANIAGATNQAYVPVAGDVGHTVRVQETAGNAKGEGTPAISAPTAVVLPAPPVSTAPPKISGTAQQEKTLTEEHGAWTNSPTSFAYQWQRCDSAGNNCASISGATEQGYKQVAADVGHTIRVQETASNAGGPGPPATSSPTAVVTPGVPAPPVSTGPPKISGTAQQEKTLTEEHGTWTNEPTSFTYQWQQCDSAGNNCTNIAGATEQTYKPVAGDVGHKLRVQETASNAGGASEKPGTSEATAVVLVAPPVSTGPPKISGTAKQGQTLTEEHGAWTNNPTGFLYQWQQCDSAGNNCTSVSGATNQTYAPTEGDVGHKLRVQETASNAGGASEKPATSEATAVVLPVPPVGTAPPKITGTAQQEKTLTEEHGTWTNNPTSFTFQWQQCDSAGNNCTSISGATNQIYVPTEGDVGHKLRVQETASNAGGASEKPATSEATAVVLPALPVNKTAPTISGVAQQGQTLTEHNGTWSNNPTGFVYQWLQCNSLGEGCLPISGATNQTYVPAAGDVGRKLRVQETASNAGGSGSAATSEATSAVIPPVPASKTPPTITGEARQGQTLTEHHGEWTNEPTSFTYQWQQCDSAGNNCTNIAAATNQTYVLLVGNVGHKLRVQEAAANSTGPSETAATSEPTPIVLPLAPSNETLPAITGTAQQGQTLTEHNGTWANSPTSFTYQWQQCNSEGTLASCTPISGATNQTYVPTEGDVGHKLRVQETASNAGGPSEKAATSEPSAVVLPAPPVSTGPPKVTGTAQQGQTLTEEHGSWSNNPTGFTYQWLQCNSEGTLASCTVISAATNQTYVPTEGDLGHKLRVQETASNAGGPSEKAATSEPTAVVVPLPPANEKPPTITGTAQQGQTLTEHNGTWSHSPTSYSYQWLQCEALGSACLPIPGATKQTYVPTSGDVGHTIRVQEVASNAGGAGAAVTSEATSIVLAEAGAPSNETPPTITGEARQGQTLTEHAGSWTKGPTSFTYQWLQCNSEGTVGSCTPISGQTKQTYELTAGDVGHRIRVQEEATNTFGTSSPATSEPTPVVVPPVPVNKALPTISGTAKQGQTLTEVHGEWTNNPTGFTYQWLQCNGEGTLASCTAITGATNQTYVPGEADVGHKLRVQETASNAGGSSENAATSEPSAVVIAAVPVNGGVPKVSGTAQQGQTLTEEHGTWSNNPTGFTYQWLQCNSEGTLASCTAISSATNQTYVPVEGDVGHRLRVQETASNGGGSSEAAVSEATAVVAPPVPTIVAPPTISGEARQGKALIEHHGEWTNNPTGFTYQWLQCNSEGTLASCTTISGATKQEYAPLAGDVGHALRVQETASNAGGPGAAATSAATSIVVPLPPSNEAPPTITGTAQQGQTLTEAHGKWTNNPTGFTYQWLQCNSEGTPASCTAISAATSQTYVPVQGDVGHRLRVQETASNAGGPSEQAALSEATAEVTPPTATFGKTTVGASPDVLAGGRKRVNRYALPTPGSVSKLSVYLAPTLSSGQQVMKGIIYSDSGGAPSSLLGVTEQLTFHSTNAAGWYDMRFVSPVRLSAGSYWIGALTGSTANVAGFRFDTVAGSRDFNNNLYNSGPSNPFGSYKTDSEQMSIYATYTPG
jgi:subtilisin family serine protease